MIDSLRAQMDAMLQSAQEQSEEALKKAAIQARRDLADRLNHVVRGFVQAETVAQWKDVFLDAIQGYCGRAALFRVTAEELTLDVARGFSSQPLRVQRSDAPALDHVIDSNETTVVANVSSEISGSIVELCSGASKIYLFPVNSEAKTLGVLLADGVAVQSAVELICSAAGLALKKAQQSSTEISKIAPAAPSLQTNPQVETSLPLWAGLPREVQLQHARAQRFARVQVAAMQLHHAQAVKSGRRTANLYSSLQVQIDSARVQFKDEFRPGEQTMIDYLHLELTENLANDDTTLLGADYPGPLA